MSVTARRHTVSVVMPVHNGVQYLRRSLPPLLSHQGARPLDVLVVDDGSTDGSAAFAREAGARVISNPAPLGPAAARNIAVGEARGEILLFVDADVVVHDDTVGQMGLAFSDPDVVAVFGSYDDQPPDPRFASRYMNLRHHAGHQHPSEDAQTFWAGLGAVRRQAFLAVRGFDAERYTTPSIEDIDLGRRLRAAGGRIRRLPGIQGTHLKRWSLGGVIRTDIFARGVPWTRLMLEHPGAFGDLNVGPGERLKAVLALALATSGVAAVAGLCPVWVPLVLLAGSVVAHRRLLALFRRSGGWWLASRGLLFHQLYYLYSSAVYIVGSVRHRL